MWLFRAILHRGKYTRKIIDGQGEEWIINPHAGDKTKTN